MKLVCDFFILLIKHLHTMKTLVQFLSESQEVNESLLDKIGITIQALLHARTFSLFKKHENFLTSYVKEYSVVQSVKTSFSKDDQLNTGVVLGEYGGLEYIPGTGDAYDDLNPGQTNAVRSFMKQSKKWMVCKDDNFAWFLPALEAWGIDVNELDEGEVIESYSSCYAIPRH